MSSNYELAMPSNYELAMPSNYELAMPSNYELVVPSARPAMLPDVNRHPDFELVVQSARPAKSDGSQMTAENTAIMVTMFNEHTDDYMAETCLPYENASIFHCDCCDDCVDNCYSTHVFETRFDTDAGTVTVFSESKSNDMCEAYRDFIERRNNEIRHREEDLAALTANFMNVSVQLANSLREEDCKVDEEIAQEVMDHHKQEIMRLTAIKSIPYKEAIRRTAVTLRYGEQSAWITHVNDPQKNLYSFMPIRMPVAGAHTPSVETVEVNRLMMDLDFM